MHRSRRSSPGLVARGLGATLALLLPVSFGACSSDSTAKPSGGCTLNSDCNDPLSCVFQRCHVSCRVSSDCPSGQRCVVADARAGINVCQVPEEAHCKYTYDCGSPLVCALDAQCRNTCRTGVDCTSGQVCANGGYCAEKSEVTSSGDLKLPDGGVAQGGAGSELDGSSSGGKSSSSGGAGGRGGQGGGAGGSSSGGKQAVLDSGIDASGGGGSSPDATAPDSSSPGGWKLWVTVNHHVYGYEQTALKSTNGDPPAIDIATTDNVSGLRFDSKGALWAMESNKLVRYDADQLKSGSPTPALTFAVNGPISYDFAPDGKLWVGRIAGGDNWIGRFDTDLHSASGSFTAILTGTPGPTDVLLKFRISAYPLGVVFDPAGDLFLHNDYMNAAGQGNLNRYDASQLVGTGSFSDPPALSILPALSGVGSAPILRDATGRILIPSGSAITRYSAAQVSAKGAGVQTVPETTFKLPDGSPPPYCIGLDPDGNLWVAGGTDSFAKIAASDVAKTSTAGAAITVTPVMKVRAPVSNPSANFCSFAFE